MLLLVLGCFDWVEKFAVFAARSLDYDHTLAHFRRVVTSNATLPLQIGKTVMLTSCVLSTFAAAAAILLVVVDNAHGLQLRERLLIETLTMAIIILAIPLIGLLTAKRAQVREDGVTPA